MSDELIVPGVRPSKMDRFQEELDELYVTYKDYHYRNCGPFKMLLLDRYFAEIDVVARLMRPVKGGERFDNRR